MKNVKQAADLKVGEVVWPHYREHYNYKRVYTNKHNYIYKQVSAKLDNDLCSAGWFVVRRQWRPSSLWVCLQSIKTKDEIYVFVDRTDLFDVKVGK